MRILGIDALFHDPAAALLVDGRTVAAAAQVGQGLVDLLAIGPCAVRGRRAFG
ncbi:hypothetical protein [Streptomyces sp. NPDC005009]